MVLHVLLTLLAILVCSTVFVQSDNPTSIVKPYDGPDPGYLVAESTTGLSNRLRVLAAYMWVAEHKFNGAHVAFIWDKTSACPGHFLQIFEPIPNVVFATNSSRYVLDKHAKIVYEDSNAVFTWIMQMNNIPKNRFGVPSWSQAERKMYARYFPNREVMMKANHFIEKHNICNSSAMHLRTTDLDRVMGERKRTNFHSYFKFVESRPVDEKVFMLTDDPKTQRIFLKKYPNKVVVFSEIAEAHEQPPLFVAGAVAKDRSADNKASAQVLAEDHRFTSLEHTLIDVIIAAHAKEFKPAGFSSLSNLVDTFRAIGKGERGWCAGY